MTVSVVLNGARSGTRVSEATRARIEAVAKRLHYRPNAVARGLSRRRMDTIGVVSIVDGGEINLYMLEVLNGILEAATRHAQNTTMFSLADWSELDGHMSLYCDGRADGLIFIAADIELDIARQFLDRGLPFATIHNGRHLPGTWNVAADSHGGALLAVRHLIEHGHRRILHLTGEEHLDTAQRAAGYMEALREVGFPVDPRWIVPGGYSAYSGRERMRGILHARTFDPLPTAIFCGNDAIAVGCMDALQERGLRVPEDVSVVGFDDTLAARSTVPPLTTVRQPFRSMGHCAVDLLLDQIAGKAAVAWLESEESGAEAPSPLPGTVLFEADLVMRRSVGPPRVE